MNEFKQALLEAAGNSKGLRKRLLLAAANDPETAKRLKKILESHDDKPTTKAGAIDWAKLLETLMPLILAIIGSLIKK